MKIVFTGGGTGGHFYPIIAIAQAIRKVVRENKLIEPKLYFLAPAPYNAGALYDEGITFKKEFFNFTTSTYTDQAHAPFL